MLSRPVDSIGVDELLKYSVWEFDLNEDNYGSGQDESWVVPVHNLPVYSLSNRLVACIVRLSNNSLFPALICNVALDSASRTSEFISLSLWLGESWFHLARYFDPDFAIRGPGALATALGLPEDYVFPIAYDLSSFAVGSADVIKGSIPAEPIKRLTDKERMQLLLP